MVQKEVPVSRTPLPLRMLGLILGSLSLLSLVRELTFVEIHGLVREGLDGYDRLVERLGAFLFGWIDWRWIRLDDAESHVLVIGLLLGGVAGRASYLTALDKGRTAPSIRASVGATIRGMIGVGGFIAIFLFLLPAPAGLWIGLILAVGILLGIVGGWWVEEEYLSATHLRRELLIAGAGAAILLVIGHFLLRP